VIARSLVVPLLRKWPFLNRCTAAFLKRVPLGWLREEFYFPKRKFVPGRKWGGKAVHQQSSVFILCLFNT